MSSFVCAFFFRFLANYLWTVLFSVEKSGIMILDYQSLRKTKKVFIRLNSFFFFSIVWNRKRYRLNGVLAV